jgi:hypothetical protein
MKGRDRNRPCPCGSGLKAKKCNPEPLYTNPGKVVVHRDPPSPPVPRTPEEIAWARTRAQEFITAAAMLGAF